MVTNNSANITGAGIVKHNAAGGFTPVTPVQYNLLIGGADNSMTSVAPTAASGVPFVSQGASANSICGTMSVAGGGIGATSLTGVLTGNGTSAVTAGAVTQYGILKAGAANAVSSTAAATDGQTIIGATSAAPAMASLSTDGSAAKSIGTNALVLHSDSTSAASSCDWSDEFLGDKIGPWTTVNTGGGSVAYTGYTASNAPGLWVFNTNAAAYSAVLLACGNFILGSGQVTVTWRIAAQTASTPTQRYSIVLGLSDTVFHNNTAIYYCDSNNSGKIQYSTAKNSVDTAVQSNITLTGIYPTFQIFQAVINAAGTSVSWYSGPTLNNLTSFGDPITTNIPTGVPISAFVTFYKGGGTASRLMYVDYVSVNTKFTTAR